MNRLKGSAYLKLVKCVFALILLMVLTNSTYGQQANPTDSALGSKLTTTQPEPRLPTVPTTFNASSSAHRIISLGDSITDGFTYQLLILQALQEAGKPVPVIINAGAGGNTAEQMFSRIDDDVLRYNPDLVILNCGMNDREKRSPTDFRADVIKILDRLHDAKVPVLMSTISVVAPKLARSQHDKLDPLNDVLHQLAIERNLPLALVREQMTKENDNDTLQEPDGIHLHLEGYRLFTRAVLDAMGYSDVPVPAVQRIAPLPGIISDWRIKMAPDKKPLTAETARSLTADDSWKPYTLPETKPVTHWWQDSMRQWGVAMHMGESISGSDKDANFWAIAIVHSDTNRDVWVNTGALVHSVWLNGGKLLTRPESPYHGWHPGRDRLKAVLHQGDNTLLIETGKWFFISLTDNDQW